MKKIYNLLLGATVLPAFVLTGCIEETFPTETVTQDQVTTSPDAADALCAAMPAFMIKYGILPSEQHYDFGYPSIMHIRDVMTADMAIKFSASGYDWFSSWAQNVAQGARYMKQQFTWWYFYQQIQTSNLAIGGIDHETESAHEQALLGAAYAYRALAYLDMAQMFECLPSYGMSTVNEEGNNVAGLTVPIVTETMTEAEAKDNGRATHEEMFEFLMADLDEAERLIVAEPRTDKTMPDIACVYGLKARAYMWNLDYPKAQEYAEKAIAAHSGTPITKAEWLDTTTGFNTITTPSWMWGMQYVQESDAVKTGLINWTSWMSNEYIAGYAAAEPFVMISADLYAKINDKDFRKLTFVAPKVSPLSGQENWVNKAELEENNVDIPLYGSLKFKPGNRNLTVNTEGCVVAVPVMRVEEMYFIAAEAAAHSNPGQGIAKLKDFMTTYRYPEYTTSAASEEDVVEEIFLQKRIEFFGEGVIYFDYKRLNHSVTRRYSGSNFYDECAFNTEGRPAWMNFVIVEQEESSNPALKGWNNPDPSDCYIDQIGQ